MLKEDGSKWNEPIVDGLDHLPTNDEILKATDK